MSARQAVVDVLAGLGTVGGIQVVGHQSEPDQKYPGAAWPVLRELSRDGTMCGPFTRTYDVFLVLPNTYAPATADVAEDLIEPLVDALEEVGEWVQPAELVQIAFDNSSTVPGIRVRITSDPA